MLLYTGEFHFTDAKLLCKAMCNEQGISSFELMKKQTTGAGGVLSFLLKDDGVEKVLNGGKLIRFAESLGGTTSLITYPQTQKHASVPKDVREKIGITPRLLRLSLGLEHIEDLLADLEQMLSRK